MNTDNKSKIKSFIERWTGKGYEKGQSQIFWTELLTDVLGIEIPSEVISFEEQVKLDHTAFIDAHIPKTHVLIEQKSLEKDLNAPIKQSDGSMLTPFQQAKRYASELPYSERPRWIVTCNFKSFYIYDMEQPQGEPFIILLENLEKEAPMLQFLVKDEDATLKHEMEVSIKAGELVGKIYDAFLKQFGDDVSPEDLHSINVLCVRLVFCLYAEDADLFQKDQFYNYLHSFQPVQMRMALANLFQVLDTPVSKRDRFLEPQLAAFPYVNGALFKQQPSETIPPFTEETANLLLDKSSLNFNWSEISPTIFGAVFESTLNPETRRSGGMHYTSIENIHKVIDPLFMDELNAEFAQITNRYDEAPKSNILSVQKNLAPLKSKRYHLQRFHEKLASLKFLDPACGSGNFLTETYISLRRLENKVIKELNGYQSLIGYDMSNPIKVNISQFYGIEINDFAVTVAKTALWIAEAQMMQETERIISFQDDYLPLKSYNNIREGNALHIPWEEVVDPQKLSYIIGNPPFVGARLMSDDQKQDMKDVFGTKWKNIGNMDYVSGWYMKAAKMMSSTNIRTALVSTNSITQGEQVANIWKPLFEDYGIHIDFAWRTFRWDSESALKAHVHCVIVGFSCNDSKERKIFTESNIAIKAQNINPYLIDAPIAWIESRNKPLCDVPEIGIGNKPIDGGNYLFSEDEMNEFIKKEPKSAKYFKKWIGADEFINRWFRYCLWLGDCTPNELRSMPECLKRVQAVRDFRLSSKSEGTRKIADKPTRFHVENMPNGNYMLIPRVSSEKRRYVPIGYINEGVLSSDSVHITTNATLYHFGILTSNVHMAWMRVVCGRLEMRYRYSKDIVYNNFPWPTPTEGQKAKIEQTAQAILDVRAKYPESSLADLYDEVTMPAELRHAHQDNDRAVMAAYGFPIKNFTESDCATELLKMYRTLTKPQ